MADSCKVGEWKSKVVHSAIAELQTLTALGVQRRTLSPPLLAGEYRDHLGQVLSQGEAGEKLLRQKLGVVLEEIGMRR